MSEIESQIEQIEREKQERQKNLDINKKVLGGIRLALKRGYNHTLKEEERLRIPEKKGKIAENLEKAMDLSMPVVIIAGIPVAVNFVAFLVLSMLSIVGSTAMFCNSNNPEVHSQVQTINNFLTYNLSPIIETCGRGFAKHFKVLMAPAGICGANATIYAIINKKRKKKTEEKQAKAEELTDEMCQLDNIIQMIKDIKNDRTDISLNFIQDFLSNVDLSSNSASFNYELLYYLSDYRTAELKEEREEGKKEETDEKFMKFISSLKFAKPKDGASKQFINNEYVKNLVDTYYVDSKDQNMSFDDSPKINHQ